LKKSILAYYIRDTIFHEQHVFKDVENLFNVDYFAHDFHDSMQDANLTYDQQQIFQHLISPMQGNIFERKCLEKEKHFLYKIFIQLPPNIGGKISFKDIVCFTTSQCNIAKNSKF
jgi:hypothetical protein